MNLHEQIGALEAGVDQLLVAATARASRIAAAAPADLPTAARFDATGVAHANGGQPQAQPVVDAGADVAPAIGADALETAAAARPDVTSVPHANGGQPQALPVADTGADVAPADQTSAAETAVTTEAANDSRPEADTPAQLDATQPESTGSGPTLTINRPSQNEIAMSIAGQTVSLNPLQVGQLIEELSNARASMQPEQPPGLPPGWRFVSTKNPVMAVQKQSNGDRLLMLRHTGHGWVPFTFSPDIVVQMYMMLTQR
jgi:hypothetical protein